MCVPLVDTGCPIPNPFNPGGSIATQILQGLAEEAEKAVAFQVRSVVSGWLYLPTQKVSDKEGVVPNLLAHTQWLVAAIAVGAVLISAIRMALQRNGKEAGEFTRGLVTMVVLSGIGVSMVELAIDIGDSYSTWIIDKAAGKELGAKLILMAPAATSAAFSGVGLIAIIVIELLLFITALVQVLMLLGRGAALVLLAGLLPVAAAAGISGGAARATRDKYVAWLIALVLYKPVAATIYAAGFWMLQGNDFNTVLTALVVFIGAVVALPALMRLITPVMSAVTSGGGGGGGLAAAGAGAELASGAMRLADGGKKGGGGGGGGAPTGAVSSAGQGAAPAAGGSMGGGAAAAGGPAGAAVAGAAEAVKAGAQGVKAVGATTASGATGGDGG